MTATKATLDRAKINWVLSQRGFNADSLILRQQFGNPIVVKEHSCSECNRVWNEEINELAGNFAFCPECAGKQVPGWEAGA